jgi:thiamine biosynthesis lipoprotein ApbE
MLIIMSIFVPSYRQELKLEDSAYYSDDNLLYHNHFAAMGTRLDMIFYGNSVQQGHRVAEVLFQEVRRLELLMSRYRKDSPVWMINQLAGTKSLQVDDELFVILLICREFHEQTGGLFDISLGSVADLIKNGEYDPATFKKLLDSSGMKQVILDPDKMTIRFRNDLVQIDFGGFGKGYALERIRKLLLSHGLLNAFISFGESSVLSANPWMQSLYAQDPENMQKVKLGVIGVGSRGKLLTQILLGIPTVKIIPGNAEHGYYAGVATLLGDQAMMERKVVKWPEELMLS